MKMNRIDGLSGSKTVKSLMLASMLALSMNGVYASTLAPVPKSVDTDTQGTLDKLAGQDIPNTDPVQKYPSSGSSYTLTKLQEGGEKPAGDNIVTKFIYNSETQTMTPVYYKLDLKQTTYGDGSEETINYNWAKNSTGNYILEKGDDLTGDNSISYKYNSSNSLNRTERANYVTDGNFINQSSTNNGGAISNRYTQISSIKGDFIGNNATSSSGIRKGGAIYNYDGDIDNITGDFINNYSNQGGAVWNGYYGHLSNIAGDFIGNSVSGTNSYGGAAYNSATIDNITGHFIVNNSSGNEEAYGGAIYNTGSNAKINNITGDFIGNYATSQASANGGAIYADYGSYIGNITGDFIGNYASGQNRAFGGAIYDNGVVRYINGNFIGNYAKGQLFAGGGALYLNSSGILTGTFIDNYVTSEGDYANGGAIFNLGFAEYINADFISNYAKGQLFAGGGALYNTGNIVTLDSDYIQNRAIAHDNASGGAVYNTGNIRSIKGDFISNSAKAEIGVARGGAIYSSDIYLEYYGTQDISVDSLSGNFYNNSVVSDNGSQGGAIYNSSGMTIVNSTFINNSAISKNGDAKGGAIYSADDLNIKAVDGYTSVISGNYVENNGVKDNNAIYMDAKETSVYTTEQDKYSTVEYKPTNLNFIAENKGKIIINDKITGQNGYKFYTGTPVGGEIEDLKLQKEDNSSYSINITGDNTGEIYLNNSISAINQDGTKGAANVNLSEVTLNLGKDNVIDGNNLSLNSGTINMVNNQVGASSLNSFTLNGDTNFVADVDLAKAEMDRFSAKSYGQHQGNLHVAGFNMLSDAPDGQALTEIYFAEKGLKDNVVNGVSETPTNYQTTAYTPIYKYNVKYDNREDGGYFMFAQGDKLFTQGGGIVNTGNPSDAFNPSVLSSPVAAQAGAYSTQLQTLNYVFNHSDSFMNIPYLERISMKYENQYALSPTGNATDVGTYSPIFTKNNNAGVWVKPYSSFESIPLKNGPKVSNINYGTLIGFDSEMKSIKRGFERVLSGYIGYNGSSQRYSGVDSTQNGGLVGGTLTLYKGNFFNATTVSAGASVANNTNMYGKEDLTMLLAGIGNKTGYNFEFKEGRFILQPSLLLSYTFVNTFDYTNSAGVRIDSDPLHAIQISPGIKLIGNLPHGWQPYIGVNMVWNLLGESKVRANDVMLPEMSIKPYVQYGVGVQKICKDRFTAYGQAMITNGGRNGISLTAGFRWALGKEGKPIEKVQKINTNKTAQITDNETTGTNGRTIIKQLTPAQRTALGLKPQNTTMTTSKAVFKQL